MLTSEPILAHPNYDYPFVIQTDASNCGLGAVLTQYINGGICDYVHQSRFTTGREEVVVREKEALAILWGIQSFRTYV